ncbi:TonB-dependent receptor [Lysobacter antibioticus]|uniref:TonB-dependent siderophore receptor family protein n=1 Tax=Lysobacter antibioticus TaxID=84531 RepID=A0A0S2FFB0_LYSAN|nr:TonB-dependent siderophore receptor [Lysobacter antibioticus]ALN82237.1 tonB-dependent siderophore receptor family protein [Lysobacter antibioticus]
MPSFLRPARLALALLPLCLAPWQAAATDAAVDTMAGAAADTDVHLLDQIQVLGKAGPTFGAERSRSATKTDTALVEIPQAITVLPRALIDAQGGRSLNEMLALVPGVGLNNGDGQRDQVAIRGFSALSDQYLDGVRDDAMYYRDLANTERIEVLKGPSAMLFGRGSSGGLINRVSKQPLDAAQGKLRVYADSEGGRRGEFDLTGPLGVGAGRLVGAYEDSDTFREQGFIERWLIAPSYRFELGGGQLLLQASAQRDERVTDFGIPSLFGRPLEVPIDTYYGSSEARDQDYSRARVQVLNATYAKALSEDLDLRVTVRGSDYRLDRRNTLITGNPFQRNGRWLSNRRHAGNERDQQAWFAQADLVHEGERHRLLLGSEFSYERKDQASYGGIATPVDLLAPVLSPSIFNPKAEAAARSRLRNAALYVQDQIALNAQWKAVIGARYDDYRQQTRDRLNAAAPVLERSDREWSPRLGLIWMPTPQQSLYANWGESFQPSAESLPLSTVNVDLQPETTANRELGYKFASADGLVSFDAAVFETEREHIKTTDPVDPRKQISVGTQRTRGAELGFAASLLERRLDLYAGYAYLDGEIRKSNNIANGVALQGRTSALTPRHSASVYAEYLLGRGFSVGGLVQHVSMQYAAPTNLSVLPAFTRFDVNLRYRSGPWDWRLRLENAFDKRYFSSAHGSVDGFNTPGAPRTLSLTADYRF